jgi:sulfur-carrier protein
MSGTTVTVRYFAAARAAAGTETETVAVGTGLPLTALVGRLAERSPELARVLLRCSYLCDGVAVRDKERDVRPGQTVDVLPPFAGG